MEMDSGSDQEDEGKWGGGEAHITCSTVHWLCHSMLELQIQTII